MTRKSPKEDNVTELINNILVSLRKNLKPILGIFLSIVIIAGALLLVNFQRKEKNLAAMQLLDKGKLLFKENKFDNAKTILEELRRDFPQNKSGEAALIYIGESYCSLGKLNEAEASFEEYLTSYPNGEFSARAQEQLGYLMEEKGKFQEAIDAYRKVYENYPESYICPQAVLSIARCYEAEKEWQEAKRTYEELVSSYPWSSSASLARTYLEVVDWEISRDTNIQ